MAGAEKVLLTEEQKEANIKSSKLDNALERLNRMTAGQLAAYAENEFGEPLTMENGRTWLHRKVGYMEMSRVYGGLTGRAAERAAALDTPAKIAELKADDIRIDELSTNKTTKQGGNKMTDAGQKDQKEQKANEAAGTPKEKAPAKGKEKAAAKGKEKATAAKGKGGDKATAAKGKGGDKATAKKGRASKYAPTDKITMLTKDNPKRPGTDSHDRFELYRKCKTVGAFMEAGGKNGDLNWDSKHGYIKIGA